MYFIPCQLETTMFNGFFNIPEPKNELVLSFAPGSPERTALKVQLQDMIDNPVEVPIMIGGKDVKADTVVEMRCPHSRGQLLGTYHKAGADHARQAIDAANAAKREWAEMPWDNRATVLLKAAELLAGKYRQTLNAATMLSMSKTCHQA
jgi:1-pyrroline-5-carboxylate dehydrogenase